MPGVTPLFNHHQPCASVIFFLPFGGRCGTERVDWWLVVAREVLSFRHPAIEDRRNPPLWNAPDDAGWRVPAVERRAATVSFEHSSSLVMWYASYQVSKW